MKYLPTKKNRDSEGFTLYETLIAVIIVALSGLIIAGSISVVARNYETISLKNGVEMLADEYLDAISSGFENAKIVEGGNATMINPVFESEAYGCAGSYVVTKGTIVFRAATINDDNTISFRNDLRQLVPKRNQRTGAFDDENLSVEFTYTYSNGCFAGTLIVNSDEISVKRNFSCATKEYLICGE